MPFMAREWDAASYHRLSNPQYDWGLRVMARISPRGDETIIDAGCGTGRLTAGLAALLPRGRVLAVDLSQNMLRQARAYMKEVGPGERAVSGALNDAAVALGRAGIHLVCADLAALPFNAVADGIFSTAALHWVGDHDALFRSLFAALKPGGWLVAQCGGGPNLLHLRRRAEELMQSPEFSGYFRGWNPPQFYATAEETAARLRRTGFGDVATWLHREDVNFSDARTYRDFLATVTLHAHTARILDPALRGRFLDLLTEQALSDPVLFLDYWRLNIHARRPY
jgi:trans-aconitate 2-methyltransferase